MFVFYDSKLDTITSYNSYADIRKEITISYGVNGAMSLPSFYRIVNFSGFAIKKTEDKLQEILSLPNVIFSNTKGDSSTYFKIDRNGLDLTDYEINNVPSSFSDKRFYIIGNIQMHLEHEKTKFEYCRFTIGTNVYSKENDSGFLSRIQRAYTIDSIISGL